MAKRKGSGDLMAEVDESKKAKQDRSSKKSTPKKQQKPAVASLDAVKSGPDALDYIQIIVTGPAKCGKTCLVLSHMGQLFPAREAKFLSKQYLHIRPNNQPVMIWDLDSSDKFKNYRLQSYPEADIALLCFDIEKPKNFVKGNENDALKKLLSPWYNEIGACNEEVKIILVGLKRDLKINSNRIFFSREEIDHVKETWSIDLYFEISARLNKEGVNDLFTEALDRFNQPKQKTKFANCGFEFLGPRSFA